MNNIINNQDVISHLNNVYCDLRPSNIQGIGVFAIKDIPIGTNPFSNPDIVDDPYYETVISMDNIPKELLPIVDRFCYVDNSHAFIPRLGFNYVSLLRYLNHSFTPNMVLNDEGDFITTRVINKDEELTFNYDIAYGEPHGFK